MTEWRRIAEQQYPWQREYLGSFETQPPQYQRTYRWATGYWAGDYIPLQQIPRTPPEPGSFRAQFNETVAKLKAKEPALMPQSMAGSAKERLAKKREALRTKALAALPPLPPPPRDRNEPVVYKMSVHTTDYDAFTPSFGVIRTRRFGNCNCGHPVCQSLITWNQWADATGYTGDTPPLVEHPTSAEVLARMAERSRE